MYIYTYLNVWGKLGLMKLASMSCRTHTTCVMPCLSRIGSWASEERHAVWATGLLAENQFLLHCIQLKVPCFSLQQSRDLKTVLVISPRNQRYNRTTDEQHKQKLNRHKNHPNLWYCMLRTRQTVHIYKDMTFLYFLSIAYVTQYGCIQQPIAGSIYKNCVLCWSLHIYQIWSRILWLPGHVACVSM